MSSKISSPVLFWGILILVAGISYSVRVLFTSNGIWNSGIGLSIYLPSWIIFVLSIVLLGVLGYLAYSPKADKLTIIGSAITCGGGLSNLVDRVIHGGKVWDYLPFWGLGYFNVADIAVFVGLVLLLISWVPSSSHEYKS